MTTTYNEITALSQEIRQVGEERSDATLVAFAEALDRFAIRYLNLERRQAAEPGQFFTDLTYPPDTPEDYSATPNIESKPK